MRTVGVVTGPEPVQRLLSGAQIGERGHPEHIRANRSMPALTDDACDIERLRPIDLALGWGRYGRPWLTRIRSRIIHAAKPVSLRRATCPAAGHCR